MGITGDKYVAISVSEVESRGEIVITPEIGNAVVKLKNVRGSVQEDAHTRYDGEKTIGNRDQHGKR